MSSMDRRKFLGVVGAGTAAISTAALPTAAAAAASAKGPARLAFRAEAALPGPPWPAYATATAEGQVDLQSGTGFVALRMLAGQPGNQAGIALPGTARLIRITSAATVGSRVHLHGVVEDRSTLTNGESARKTLILDQANKQLRTMIAGTDMYLTLLPRTG